MHKQDGRGELSPWLEKVRDFCEKSPSKVTVREDLSIFVLCEGRRIGEAGAEQR